MAFATTSNAVPLPIAAVPVVEVDAFRRDVLAAVGETRNDLAR